MKKVLMVGFDPALVARSPEFKAAQMTPPDETLAALAREQERLRAAGFEVENLFLDLGETAESVVREKLRGQSFACINVGAGLRTNPRALLLFERIINAIHELAPASRICFNATAADVLAAFQRWT
ncbi:MAG TPA: hypothetical protein VMB50_08265 [Myxococcales bacterium]|nr:hypothetical protein [Myxococcales bacterium]